MRWQLKQRLLRDGLVKRYARFVITRSDQFFGCPLLVSALDLRYIWVPEGEDYGGITDRVMICSSREVVDCPPSCLDRVGLVLKLVVAESGVLLH